MVADKPNQICDISVQAVAGGAAPSHLVRRTEVGAARREGASFRFDEFAVKQNTSDLEIISTRKIFWKVRPKKIIHEISRKSFLLAVKSSVLTEIFNC